MKSRLILSFLLIALVGSTAFATTKAVLSDTATLDNNTFATGTVDLQIATSQSTNPSSGSFTVDPVPGFTDTLVPGQTKSKLFWLKNNSDNIDLAIAAQAGEMGGSLNASDVTITFTPVQSDGVTSVGSPVSGTLNDWAAGVTSLGNTIDNDVNSGRQRFKMDVSLSSTVTTTGTINFDFVFTGTQINP